MSKKSSAGSSTGIGTECAATVNAQHGHLAAIVTCAGRGLAGTAEQTSIDAATTELAINFWGTVRVVATDLA